MPKRMMLAILLVCFFFTAGCSDTLSFTPMIAAEFVTEGYGKTCPVPGDINVLATKKYDGGMLVLANKHTDNGPNSVELFFIRNDEISKLATGVGAGDQLFSVNRLVDGKNTLLFGEFTVENKSGEDLKRPYEKAVMTLKNWHIIEEDVEEGRGFILTIKRTESVQKFDLYNTDGKLTGSLADLPRGAAGIHVTSFVAMEDLPTPRPLTLDIIQEVRVEPLTSAEKGESVVLKDSEDYQEFIEVYNRNFKELTRYTGLVLPELSVAVICNDGQKVIFRNVEEGLTVTYEKGEQIRHFLLKNEEMAEAFTALATQMKLKN